MIVVHDVYTYIISQVIWWPPGADLVRYQSMKTVSGQSLRRLNVDYTCELVQLLLSIVVRSVVVRCVTFHSIGPLGLYKMVSCSNQDAC